MRLRKAPFLIGVQARHIKAERARMQPHEVVILPADVEEKCLLPLIHQPFVLTEIARVFHFPAPYEQQRSVQQERCPAAGLPAFGKLLREHLGALLVSGKYCVVQPVDEPSQSAQRLGLLDPLDPQPVKQAAQHLRRRSAFSLFDLREV